MFLNNNSHNKLYLMNVNCPKDIPVVPMTMSDENFGYFPRLDTGSPLNGKLCLEIMTRKS